MTQSIDAWKTNSSRPRGKVSPRAGGCPPVSAEEWIETGNHHLRRGTYDLAISAFTRAIQLAPESGAAYGSLGLVYFHKGWYADALPLYKKSLELLKSNKDKAVCWNRIGDACRRLNDDGAARTAYQKASELDAGGNPLLQRARLAMLGNASE